LSFISSEAAKIGKKVEVRGNGFDVLMIIKTIIAHNYFSDRYI